MFDLDLRVGAGEIVALIGSNGSGKTSTLRAISRTLPRTEGGIHFEGHDLLRIGGHQVVGLGIAHVPRQEIDEERNAKLVRVTPNV